MAPDGQAAAHDGFRQCSQMRGTKYMKDFSYSALIEIFDSSRSFLMIGSSSIVSWIPPSESSQLALALIAIFSPVTVDLGRATGKSSPSGALVRFRSEEH